jgi:hypothetical protein
MDSIIKTLATAAGYTEADQQAGWEFFQRKTRRKHPPGKFDNAKRFTAAERTEKVETARSPSRAFPLSEMAAARTAEHCAELHGATPLHVKRIAKACELLESPTTTAHEQMEQVPELSKILKKVKVRSGA